MEVVGPRELSNLLLQMAFKSTYTHTDKQWWENGTVSESKSCKNTKINDVS